MAKRVVCMCMCRYHGLRANVNVFVDAENIRFSDGLESPVGDGSAIYILSAISGG